MRPTYETPAHRLEERRVGAHLAKLWKCDFRQHPIMYTVDLSMIRDGKVVCFIEVKTRTTRFNTFTTYELSLDKFVKLKAYAHGTGLPVLLAVRFACGSVAYRRIEETDFPVIVYGGRYDRGDSQDLEPLAQFDINEFIVVEPISMNGHLLQSRNNYLCNNSTTHSHEN